MNLRREEKAMTGIEDRFSPPARFADAGEQLHDLVSQQLGSDDFGPDDYLPGLQMLLLSFDYDPHLTELGRQMVWGEAYNALFARAHTYRALKQNPACLQQQIGSPVVITGIPRTGTTALHKLMAVDEQFQGLQTWLIGNPMPRPPRETWDGHPYFQKTVAQLERRYQHNPDRKVAHMMAAEEVDECCLILRQGFVSNVWSCAWSAASYDLWLQTQSERHCYDHLQRALQLIGSNDPNKRWLLKNPGHIANLDLLFAVFPDARVIQTHRDPASAIPSLCAMFIRSHDVLEGASSAEEKIRRDLRARLLGIREMEKWARAIEDAEPVRRQYRDQVLDVIHQNFHRDPLGEIERIYRFINADLSDTTLAAMRQRISDDPERQHGKHRYHVSDFGLTEAQIRARFGDYNQRFGL